MMFEGLGSVSWLPIAVFVLANEKRTQDAGHALLRQDRNPKVRKNSDVIHMNSHKEVKTITQDLIYLCGQNSPNI